MCTVMLACMQCIGTEEAYDMRNNGSNRLEFVGVERHRTGRMTCVHSQFRSVGF